MIVLSLFDGCGMAYQALKNLGIKVDKYYSCEIDKYAMQIARKNHPDIIDLGDITHWESWNIEKPDLIIGGSPCQGLSIAGKRLNLEDPRSKLFFKFMEVLNHYKPKYFVLENVASMKTEVRDIISEYIGIEPILINSSLLSSQSRKRLYWTNIKGITQPEDENVLLKDILEDDVDEKYFVSNKAKVYITNIDRLIKKHTQIGGEKGLTLTAKGNNNWTGTFVGTARLGHFNSGGQGDRIYDIEGKSVSLSANGGGTGAKTGLYAVSCGAIRGRYNEDGKIEQRLEINKDEKTNSITTVTKDNIIVSLKIAPVKSSENVIENISKEEFKNVFNNIRIRKLTPIECERLQTLEDRYTEGVSDSQRYKMLGNGFTVKVIEHILKNMEY